MLLGADGLDYFGGTSLAYDRRPCWVLGRASAKCGLVWLVMVG